MITPGTYAKHPNLNQAVTVAMPATMHNEVIINNPFVQVTITLDKSMEWVFIKSSYLFCIISRAIHTKYPG